MPSFRYAPSRLHDRVSGVCRVSGVSSASSVTTYSLSIFIRSSPLGMEITVTPQTAGTRETAFADLPTHDPGLTRPTRSLMGSERVLAHSDL